MAAALVEVRGLRFRYPDGTQALNGIDFSLEAGESVALFGANGSGKTTFVMHLNGLLAGEGSINVCGLAVESGNLETIRGKVGLVFQDADSQLFMPTVLEDVAFGLLNRGMEPAKAADRARSALQAVGMSAAADRAPYHLSAGEKKRVALAGILAMDPEILVLDEPTTFLDPPGQRTLADLLRGLSQAKMVITHNVRFAQAVCDRAVFFEHGKIAAHGPVEEMIARFDWDFVTEPTKFARR
ncbi:MAG TPA: ABC transporter ATP-binding protein [Bryobacteraceae bacterium]|nr:ABC transporter ATP-binding protein [Bryobacteraceae bacterium]